MARIGITFKEVFQTAETLIAKGQNPTQDNIREYLGRGSRGTIHKYLKQWKQKCFEKGTMGANGLNALDDKAVLEEKRALEQIIAKQITQNETLTSQLVAAEREIVNVREKAQRFEVELGQLKSQYLQMEAEYQGLQQAYQVMRDEREMAIQAIMQDKNQQIESLRQELREVNQASLMEVREVGYKGDEALMDEKVKTLNLKEQITALQQTVEALQQQLAREQQISQPLRKEVERQKKLIERVVTFEQLKAYRETE